MIVQSASMIMKQRNQPNRECLYAWYPEVITDTESSASMVPRDIYIHKGIDKDLIQDNTQINGLINSGNNNNVVQRYKQSIAPSEQIYHSTETLDEALRTPWALHFDLQRRPATPNFPSNSNDLSTREDIPRRLKSAPLVRPLPPTSILTIPEPRFVTPMIPVPTNQISQPTPTRPRTRASSAKARLNTTFPISNEQINDDFQQQQQQRREIRSAQVIRQNNQTKFSDKDNQQFTTQVYNGTIQQQEPSSLPPTPPPGYVYQKSATWSPTETPATPVDRRPLRSTIDINSVALNPYYVHRPGVISVRNSDKKPVVRESSAYRKLNKHHRRSHHHHHRDTQNQPLLALTPIGQPTKIPFELDGIKLTYDPTLTIDDPSLNLTKYFVEGRLYLIKDQRYNVLENIDPASLEKYNQNSNLPQRPKYYQTIPVEKFQIPKPAADIHYNASETYFYNTLPKRVHRYVIDPNFISENLNVNKISLSKRPPSATVVHSTINDFNRQQATPTTVYA